MKSKLTLFLIILLAVLAVPINGTNFYLKQTITLGNGDLLYYHRYDFQVTSTLAQLQLNKNYQGGQIVADVDGYYTISKLIDQSGYGNNGTCYNGVQVVYDSTGTFPKALKFDGENAYVEVADSDSLNVEEVTVEVLFKTTSEAEAYLMEKLVGGWGWNTGYGFYYSNKRVRAVFGIGGEGTNYHRVDCTTLVNDGLWHHVVGTAKPNNYARIYLDAQFKTEEETTNLTLSNSIAMHIGEGFDHYFNGYIALVRIYNRALNLTEIQHNYNNPLNPVTDGLVLWLDAEHTSVQRIYIDETGRHSYIAVVNDTGNSGLVSALSGSGIKEIADNVLAFYDATFYNGTNYVDVLGSDDFIYDIQLIDRVEADSKFFVHAKNVYGDGKVHLKYFPLGWKVKFIQNSQVKKEVTISSDDMYVDVPSGTYEIMIYEPVSSSVSKYVGFLYYGNLIGLITGYFTDLIGGWFYVILLSLIIIPIYVKTQSVFYAASICLILSLVLSTVLPIELAKYLYLLVVLSFAAVLYKLIIR